MRGYAAARAPKPALDALDRVRRLVACWPDTVPGERDHWISCHALAAVLEEFVPGTRRVDGHFLKRGYEHSWLALVNHPRWVIDPYPIADVSGPVLRDVEFPSPWHDAYVPRNLPRLDLKALAKQIETLHACVLVGGVR